VQSVAVKIIVEKEREIRAFDAVEYWLIPAVFTVDLQKDYSSEWLDFITPKQEGDNPPTLAMQYKSVRSSRHRTPSRPSGYSPR